MGLIDGVVVFEILRDMVGLAIIDLLDLTKMSQIHLVPHFVSNEITTGWACIQSPHQNLFTIKLLVEVGVIGQILIWKDSAGGGW